MTLATSYSRMAMAANEIILRRTHQMATGTMSSPEALSMVMEKGTAFAAASERATLAAVRGGDVVKIMTAALGPYGAKTRSNVRKLRK